jgi:DNA primase
MATIGQDQIETLRERADIVEIIGAHVRLRQSGRSFIGLCPFHNEKTPSFTVSRERGFFHCFGCGAGGTVFNFLMRMEGLNFPEAVRALAQRYGIALTERGPADARAASEREIMLRAAALAADFYAHVLWETPVGSRARQYLAARGIEPATARAFKLGFAPGDSSSLIRALHKRGLRESAVRIGLLRETRDLFAGRLVFPIRDSAGRTVAFGGRVLDARLPKYINSPESPIYSKARSLYGLYEARQAIGQSDRAVLVEGYLDAIALAQAGFKEVVASLGTSLTVEQLRLLSRYTRNVMACFDGDGAGHNASLRALRVFLEAGLLGRGIFIPRGFDPDTFVREHGAQAFAQLVGEAQLLVEYFIQTQAQAAAGFDGKARAAENVAQVLTLINNPFEFDLVARKAAEMLGVREELFRRQARKSASASAAAVAPGARQAGRVTNMLTAAEYGLLAIAAAFPQLREDIASAAVAREFADRELAKVLEELLAEELDHEATQAYLARQLSAEHMERLSAQIVDAPLTELETARFMIGEYARALRRWHARNEIGGLLRSAASAGAEEATAAAQELILRRRGERKDGSIGGSGRS